MRGQHDPKNVDRLIDWKVRLGSDDMARATIEAGKLANNAQIRAAELAKEAVIRSARMRTCTGILVAAIGTIGLALFDEHTKEKLAAQTALTERYKSDFDQLSKTHIATEKRISDINQCAHGSPINPFTFRSCLKNMESLKPAPLSRLE